MSTISREELISLIDHRIKHTKDARKRHTSEFVDGMKDGYARIRSDVQLMPPAEPERKTCYLECLRCKQAYNYSWDTMDEISYTMYSYCPDCIRKGILLLKSHDKEGARE